MVIQAFLIRDGPNAVAVVEQGCLMRVYSGECNLKFVRDLLRTETSCEGLEDFELSWSCFFYDFGTISTILGLHLGTLLFLRGTEGISRVVNIGPQRKKWALNQLDSPIGGDMHHLAFISLLFDGF